MVMPRFGANLQQLFTLLKEKFSRDSILSLAIRLLDILEQIHSAGYTFNDLKLDNILLDLDCDVNDLASQDGDIFEKNNINLVDFGFASRYTAEQDGAEEHIEKDKIDYFKGNMMFSSLSQLKFYKTSRRDDLISLFYLMVYLFKGAKLPQIELTSKMTVNEQFMVIRDAKQDHRTADLCFENTQDLADLRREIFSYRFKDQPRYSLLRKMLWKLREKDAAAVDCTRSKSRRSTIKSNISSKSPSQVDSYDKMKSKLLNLTSLYTKDSLATSASD